MPVSLLLLEANQIIIRPEQSWRIFFFPMNTTNKAHTNAGIKGAYLFQGQVVAGDLPVTFHDDHWCFDPAPEAISADAAILYDESDPDSAQIFNFHPYRPPVLGPDTFLRLLISK